MPPPETDNPCIHFKSVLWALGYTLLSALITSNEPIKAWYLVPIIAFVTSYAWTLGRYLIAERISKIPTENSKIEYYYSRLRNTAGWSIFWKGPIIVVGIFIFITLQRLLNVVPVFIVWLIVALLPKYP